jgi:type VI secretion system protein ImpA
MNSPIDTDAILAPIAGAEPSGEYLFYSPVYDEIRQARRCEDPAYAGEGEAKESEWGKVLALCQEVLAQRSKDLLVAAWLTEALVMREGFEGLHHGLSVLEGLVEKYWESVFPLVEDDDYDGRAAPFEFLNEKISLCVKQIPLTDPKSTPGYTLLKWKESRTVGYEADGRKEQREELLTDGKISAEQFDLAVNRSSGSFYRGLAGTISRCVESFKSLEAAVDGKFGRHAPSLSKLGEAFEECHRVVLKICQEQKGLRDALELQEAAPKAPEPASEAQSSSQTSPTSQTSLTGQTTEPAQLDSESQIWAQALSVMQEGSFKKALDLLLAAASSQPSERGRCRYRLLVAKLCLKAGHPELARPIVEQLAALVTELQLEKWESPFWVCEILEALYQCLVTGENADEEASRAKELFQKICTLDVTKALK